MKSPLKFVLGFLLALFSVVSYAHPPKVKVFTSKNECIVSDCQPVQVICASQITDFDFAYDVPIRYFSKKDSSKKFNTVAVIFASYEIETFKVVHKHLYRETLFGREYIDHKNKLSQLGIVQNQLMV